MDISKKIYALRTSYNLTQTEFGKIAGVSDKAVSAWENGIRDPKIKPIQRICDHFGIDINAFIDQNNEVYKAELPTNVIPVQVFSKIPLIGQIACGAPILAEENIEDYIDAPGHIHADYALTCKGDSMINAGINDGDIVYIRKQETVENGQIAVVMVGEDEATLKRFYLVDGVVTLNAENPAYPPKVFVGEEAAQIHVIGLAVAFLHHMV